MFERFGLALNKISRVGKVWLKHPHGEVAYFK